jgi:hypothetical protein
LSRGDAPLLSSAADATRAALAQADAGQLAEYRAQADEAARAYFI